MAGTSVWGVEKCRVRHYLTYQRPQKNALGEKISRYYVAQRLACRLPDWICLDDLISTGVLGLMDAIEKYDPTRGTTFKTYAEWRIRGAMLDELRELDWAPRTVRQTEHALQQAYAEPERQH